MEIRTLRYFLTIAREENMTRAAEYLHVTQPTLSKQMQSLEEELGKKLFTRHSFSIELTEEGYLLKKRAEDLISMADKIIGEFVSLDEITGGDLYFGLAESCQIRFLARVIKAGLPLFCSGQGWEKDIPNWCGEKMENMRLEGSFRLSYNASLFVKEGLGYLLTLDGLVDTGAESGLVFRPLSPKLETKIFLVWKKYQVLTPIAEKFLRVARSCFEKK